MYAQQYKILFKSKVRMENYSASNNLVPRGGLLQRDPGTRLEKSLSHIIGLPPNRNVEEYETVNGSRAEE
jgi:hypothetical protein